MAVVGASRTLTQAAKYVRDRGPDLVLIGVGLPGAKALELVAEIRAARTNKRIIALVLLDDGHVHAARSAGADDVVLEDRITTDLLPALRRVVLTASS